MGNISPIQAGNEYDELDGALIDLLGVYVYALRDPRDQKIFYVGKGGGQGASGNDRVLHHFMQARDALSSGESNPSAKVRRIIEIWSVGEDVEWFIVRHGLQNSDLAHHVEGALIDLLEVSQNGPTLNIQGGHQAATHGFLSRGDLESLKAQPVNPKRFVHRPIFVFPIQRALTSGRSVIDSTSGSWRVGVKFRQYQDAIAVGVSSGVSKGAFLIERWLPDGRVYRFEGSELDDPNRELVGRNFLGVINKAKGFWQRGNYLVVEFDGSGKVKFLRGLASDEWIEI